MSFKRIYSQGQQLKEACDILSRCLMSEMKGVDGLEVRNNLI